MYNNMQRHLKKKYYQNLQSKFCAGVIRGACNLRSTSWKQEISNSCSLTDLIKINI